MGARRVPFRSRGLGLGVALLVLWGLPACLGAQQSDVRREILESERRLAQIRAERARLQAEME